MKRSFALSEKRHFLYLLFWPAFGLRYLFIEQYSPVRGYYPISCPMDEWIPFQEGFIIPYFLWHTCIIGMHLWLCFRDIPTFRRYSHYLIVSMSISTAIFLLFPTCQNLRPDGFPRNNLLTKAVQLLYRMDTNTNVCPSEHVIGAVGFFMAALHSEKLRQPNRIVWIGTAAFLTAIATVFLKQHSVVDVAAAIPVCAVGYLFSFSGFSIRDLGCRIRNHISAGRFSA